MVLFYCTVVAMKRQDQHGVPNGLDDFFQPGENMEFSGYVSSPFSLSLSLSRGFRRHRV